jgi:hypothetical protein
MVFGLYNQSCGRLFLEKNDRDWKKRKPVTVIKIWLEFIPRSDIQKKVQGHVLALRS